MSQVLTKSIISKDMCRQYKTTTLRLTFLSPLIISRSQRVNFMSRIKKLSKSQFTLHKIIQERFLPISWIRRNFVMNQKVKFNLGCLNINKKILFKMIIKGTYHQLLPCLQKKNNKELNCMGSRFNAKEKYYMKNL